MGWFRMWDSSYGGNSTNPNEKQERCQRSPSFILIELLAAVFQGGGGYERVACVTFDPEDLISCRSEEGSRELPAQRLEI